jgi:hypothetical protein
MPFNRPVAAIQRVLTKLGIDPATRIDRFDQDPEYTACRPEELPAYFRLYEDPSTDSDERAALCCFMLESLNDFCGEGAIHPLQQRIFDALLDVGEAHSTELAYWSDSDDPDPTNWWPIAGHILEHKATRSQTARELRACDECDSDYFADSSKMAKLCPECASLLYGHPVCQHVLQNGRCTICWWDGSRSVFTAALSKSRPTSR